VEAGTSTPDPELAAFLTDLLATARAEPGSATARGNLGMAYEINGFTDAALASYAQAEALAPATFTWPYYTAVLRARRGDLEAALAAVDRALAIDAAYAPAWLWRGNWLLDVGRHQDAEAAFARATEHAGDASTRAAAVVGTARVQLARGQSAAAIPLLESLPGVGGHPYVQRLLGRAYRESGRPEAAAVALAASAEAVPMTWSDPRQDVKWRYVRGFTGLLNYGQALLKSQRPDAALEVMEPLRERHGDDRMLLNNLAVAYAATGRRDEAMATLRQALALYPDEFAFHLNIANRFLEGGDAAQALPHLDRVVALNAALAAGHETRGMALMYLGRDDEALQAFTTAGTAAAHVHAGMLEGTRERWPAAIAHFERALRLAPADARAQLFLARSLGEAKRLDEAAGALARARALGAEGADLAAAEQRLAAIAQESTVAPHR